MTVTDVARVCHEANRAYYLSLGDESQAAWQYAPDWQQQAALSGVRAILAGMVTTGEQAHQAWVDEQTRDGWIYGAYKDPEAKRHPHLVPYDQLMPEIRAKDELFVAIVRALEFIVVGLIP